MEEVTKAELLDRESVKDYLSMVAPEPFSKDFPYGDKISKYFNANNVVIDEYNVTLNGTRVYKAYKSYIIDKDENFLSLILDVDFFNIKSDENELIAIGWYGITDSLNRKMSVKNIERGFRIRKNNIGIGSEKKSNEFFKDERFNYYYIGEIHVLGSAFLPNARRDYFNDSKTVRTFENGLTKQFKHFTNLARTASNIHSRLKDIKEYKEVEQEFDNKRAVGFFTDDEENIYKRKLEITKKRAISAKNSLSDIEGKSVNNSVIEILYDNIVGETDLVISESETIKKISKEFRLESLTKLAPKERNLISEIFSIIDSTLSPKESTVLKRKIVEHYK